MLIKKKLSISRIFFSNMLFIATLSSFIIGFIWINHERNDFNQEASNLKHKYLDTQKQLTRNAVENAINYINYKKALTQEHLKQNIRKRVYEAHSVATNIYQHNSGNLPDDEIIELIKQALRPVRFFDNRNYYFIDDLEGNSVLFPPKADFEGKSLMHLTNKEGIKILSEVIQMVKEKGEGDYVYNWVKYTEGRIPTNEEFPKITYFKLFEPYNWFIAVGEYLDYVEDDIRKEILERIARISFGNSEHVNIHTFDGIKLVSGGQVLDAPIKGWDLTDADGIKLFQNFKKAAQTSPGEYVSYTIKDNVQDRTRLRISFAGSIPDWQWIITAGTYIDEVDQVIAREKAVLKEEEKAHLFKIFFILAGLLLITFLIARYISFKANSSFKIFSKFFKKASTESITIDEKLLHFSEFSDLAHAANQMVEKRHQAEERFRQLAEYIREVFWIVSPDWREILYISPAYEEVWGRSCESLYQNPTSWRDSIIKEDLEMVRNYIKQRSSGNRDDIIFPEYRILRPDGSIRWIFSRGFPVLNNQGEIYRIAGIAEDITEQKESEQAIQALVESTVGIIGQNFFDQAVRHLCKWLNCDIALVGELEEKKSRIKAISMIVDGRINYDYSYDLPFSPCEVVIKNGFCIFPENIQSQFPNDKNLFENNAAGYVGTRLFNRNGEIIGVLNALSRKKLNLPKRTKDVLNIIAARVSAEIERKNAEIEKNRIGVRLRQSQKMESIGTLAGGIAHDFNNILYPIIGFTEICIEDTEEGTPLNDNLKEVLAASIRARDLVKQILMFSRQDDQEQKPVRIQQIIKDTFKLTRASLPATIAITQEIKPDCGPVMANPTQIHQVLMNLCANAYHAMQETGGTLNIQLTEIEIGAEDLAAYPELTPGRFLKLIISDTGEGMDPTTLARIFDPYFTTKKTGKGTGLGLSVVHGIIKNHEGHIDVYSEPGKGTIFKIYLPRIEHDSIPPEIKFSSDMPGGNENILLVDDEPQVIQVTHQILERLGYHVESRPSGAEALNLFMEDTGKFDLVITDQTMPIMTGDILALRLITLRSDIPIILCTGFNETVSAKKAKETGIKKYVMKPIIMQELANTVREVLDDAKHIKLT